MKCAALVPAYHGRTAREGSAHAGRQTGTKEWRAARGELGTQPHDSAAEAAAGASDVATAAVARNNTTALTSNPSLHSHKLDDMSVAQSVLESVASAASAGKNQQVSATAAENGVTQTPLQSGASAPALQALAAPRKLLSSAMHAALSQPDRQRADGQQEDALSVSMQERLQIAENGKRAAKVKDAFATAVQQEFMRLMAAGGITANEAANLALKHAVAQQQHVQA